ncbi:uncharacterized protein FIBRA_02249 [Fibroporia radiculosa]|uniref:GED domain-containing protein n=1 Tax=Fibroporia radiculosa TaxID=599839 RepID=J4I8Y5_9APHY|nr:uncharacterized protein FIBRA_02249 [Fibroporia radiculosa]CCM00221.1 predicted protein [Fibroporia radiculosa]
MKRFISRRGSSGDSSTGGLDPYMDSFVLSDTEYARKRQVIFNLIRDLKAMGANMEDIKIPRIVVIVGQPAGKSSLIEAITQINVPRDGGTCPRCPMECNVSTNSAKWSCRIYLDRRGVRAPFSPELTSKDSVEIWLRRAQAAILSRSVLPEDFKEMSKKQLEALTLGNQIDKFSSDSVVVDIEATGGTDLSFNEDENMIELVRSLVEKNIQESFVSILMTVPANDEMENQQAASLARKADPNGDRTVGIVTKPDAISDGSVNSQQSWLKIIQGKDDKHMLKLGYYVVRLPQDTERAKRLSPQELNRLAIDCFSTKEPWKELYQSDVFQHHLGIPNLVEHLSRVLMNIIHNSLPDLQAQIRDKLAQCDRDLQDLPEMLVGDPTAEAVARIADFCTDLRASIYGYNEDKDFIHATQDIYERFVFAIACTTPNFRPEMSPYVSRFVSGADDLEQLGYHLRSADFKLAPVSSADVRTIMKKATGWELPHNTPYDAKVCLIEKSIELWHAPSQACFDEVTDALRHWVDEKISEHFGQFRAFEGHMSRIMRNEIDCHVLNAQKALTSVLECEEAPYTTVNTRYYNAIRSKWLQSYAPQYGTYNTPSYPYEPETLVMADVRAYFQRIIDYVLMIIQRHLNQELVDDLSKRLLAKLELSAKDASSHLAALMVEDPVISAKRAKLESRKNRLQDMQTKLNGFTMRW